jgi:UDP-N-acetylglucosamine 3-dehydrogenase
MTTVAVVGVGSMGKNHARVYHEMPNVELVGVVDQNINVARTVGHLFHVPAYSDFREMVAREQPDAVSVVVPSKEHFTVAHELLHAGCHVLVEKPLATTLLEAQSLIESADRLGRVLMVGHIERYNPAIIELRRRLDAGQLGRIFEIQARRLGPFPARISDVGVIMDLATHDIDIMRYLTRSEALRVFAETRHVVHPAYEDMFVGTVRFANDVVGMLEINWLTPRKIRELTVTGERGMFCVDYITQDLRFCENAEVGGDDWAPISLLRGVREGPETRFALDKKEPLRMELEAFISQVLGQTTNAANGRDGRAAMEIAIAFAEAAQSGRTQELVPLTQHEAPNGALNGSQNGAHNGAFNAVPVQ